MKRAFGFALILVLGSFQSAPAAFVFNFDENGNGSISVNGGASQTLNGTLQLDPSQPSHPAVLTYNLAGAAGLVGNGDVAVFDNIGQTVVSDLLRFTDANGNLGGGTADRMIFYSLSGGGLIADTGLPGNAGTSLGVTEAANGTFQFVAGGPNIYNGTSSPSAVPEPSTLVMAGTSVLMGLGLAWRRQRSARVAARPAGQPGALGV